MTQTYDEQGKVVPVTVIKAMPVTITQIRTIEKDGYSAVQVGTGERNKINKPLAGHLKEAGKFKKLKEFRNGAEVDSVVGNKFDVSVFSIGDKVKISGLTKGRGFMVCQLAMVIITSCAMLVQSGNVFLSTPWKGCVWLVAWVGSGLVFVA